MITREKIKALVEKLREVITVENVKTWAGVHLRPITLLIVITIISCYFLPEQGGAGEFFPLTSYPMYSSNGSKSFVVYLKDGEGNPIPSQGLFSVRTSELKKDYNTRLDDIVEELGFSDFLMTAEQKRPAAEDTLNFLIHTRAPERVQESGLKALQLVDLRLVMVDNKLQRTEEVIARVEIP